MKMRMIEQEQQFHLSLFDAQTKYKFRMNDKEVLTVIVVNTNTVSVKETEDINGGTIIEITATDLSDVTVSPEVLLNGYTAVNAYGEKITGTYTGDNN